MSQGRCAIRFGTIALQRREVSFDGQNVALAQDFSYTTNWPSIYATGWTSKTTTVVTTDYITGESFETDYLYTPQDAGMPPNLGTANAVGSQIPQEQTITYKKAGSTVKTVAKTWTGSEGSLLASEQVTIAGQTSLTTRDYIYSFPIEEDQYDFGPGVPGPLLKRTVVNIASIPFTRINGDIIRPASIITCNTAYPDPCTPTSSNRVAETDYSYDETPVTGVANLTGHDENNYDPSYNVRGNLTTGIHRCFVPSTGAPCQDSITHYTYDETGQVTSKTDALGHVITYDYADHFTEGGTPTGNTNAYLTKITYPTTSANGVSHIQSYTYAYQDGLLTSSTDQNQQTTRYLYDDPLRRLTSVTGPPDPNNGGQQAQTTYFYNDNLATFPMVYVMETTKIDSSNVTRTWTGFDGMGRKVRFAKVNGEGTSNMFDMTDTCYGGLGQVSTQNYPFQGPGWAQSINCSPSTGDSFTYDALGRTTQVTHPDGSHVNTDYSQFPTVTSTDEANKQRRNRTDALGRLTTVWEPDSSGNFAHETDYQYDTLNNLIHVDQKGGTSDSTLWRTRNFVYDSLSRLLTATNPESGTINYAYDVAGNLISKTAPAPNQSGSATVTTSYSYDALNRLTTRTFSDNSHSATYIYDQTPLWGVNVQNPVGRLVGTYGVLGNLTTLDGSSGGGGGGSVFSYDVMGRLIQDIQFNQHVLPWAPLQYFNYTYNLDGSLKTLQYPSGRTITYSYNTGQRPVSAVDVANNINYYTGAHYTAFGAPASMVYGATPTFAGITWSNTYNARMQPVFLTATTPSSTVFSLGYDFHLNGDDNGNVYAVNNNKITDHGRDQSFTYDQLNRLVTAQSAATSGPNCWGESFGYDPWANMTSRNVTKCSAEGPVPSVNAKNQMNGSAYDAAGNLLTGGYTYNSENQLIASPGVAYDYNVDGERVQKSDGTLYLHGLGGQVLEETNLSGTLKEEYIFFGGKRIARREDGAFQSSATMQNGSFSQANPLDQPPCLCYNFGPIPGWTSTGAQTGSWQPNTSSYNAPLPGIVAYSNGGTISQTLATGLQPNTTYTLLVDVGHRLEGGINNYSLTLQAGSTVLATTSGSNGATPPGSFLTERLTYTTGSAPPAGNVTIVLTSFGPQINFKNVRLNLSSVGAVHYYFADHLGSNDIVTNASGIIEEEREFYPYGGERVITDSGIGNNYKFTGKERDPETGLDEFGARYYSSALGRFTIPDWAEAPTAVPYANFGNPQSLNLYSYVKNNPTTFGDPDGHSHCEQVGETLHCISDKQWEEEKSEAQWKAFLNQWGCLYNFLGYLSPNGPAMLLGIAPRYHEQQPENIFQARAMRAIAIGNQMTSVGPMAFTAEEQAIATALEVEGNTVVAVEAIQGQKNADALVNGIATEFKTVRVAGTNTLKNQIQDAVQQGQNIVIDTRGTSITKAEALQQIARAEGNVGNLQGRVTIVTKEGILKY